ncbi:MAG: DUF4231 domain-containing protein [Trichodesmium sp. St16_bin4-tuft]|nr:DUF4231 domain-containing protein [Trichodesmium sp. St18_bin3_1_1]MDE5100054.1 DUF4231 domain-containing protein [Trichodesmium sp. St16_bin4-tuft]MDE5103896.1 DUF4231 domain-containing protein [Trichodesmium sp. St19_bin2]
MSNLEIKESMTTSSKIINSQSEKIQVDISKSQAPSPNILLLFRILTYLSLVIAIASGITTFLLPNEIKLLLIILVVSISLFVFFFLTSRELKINYLKKLKNYNLLKDRDMYIKVSQLEDSPKNQQIMEGVESALKYAQRLIDNNKKISSQAKSLYYVLQIVTIIFSAVTPILVVVEKSETSPAWLKWLPVILPAFASVIASLSTSIPLEETWLSSKKAVENLEAEKEKFLLAVTTGYRIPRNAEEKERYKMTRDAMAKFINTMSNIHLKKIQDQEKTEKGLEEGEEQSKEKL